VRAVVDIFIVDLFW